MTDPGGGGISVVVNTLEAERYLTYALRSVVAWATEVVVADMGSTDGTVAVAAAQEPWVLVLDADELVPLGLSRRLRDIAAHGAVDAVRIPRVDYLLGAPLLHTGWNPERERHLRFFRPGMVDLPTRIHEPVRARAEARTLDLPYVPGEALLHFNYTDVDDFVARLARYTSVEATHAVARGERAAPLRALGGAVREWLVRYGWHGGWRDGWRGFHLASLMAAYRLIVQAKIASREQLGPEADVIAAYAGEAERVLAEYPPPARP